MTQPSATALLDADFMSKLDQLNLVSRKIFTGRMKGERRSKKKGFSVEFADYRDYVAGDDLRFIDWNIYARLDKLFLKLFYEEEDLHIYVLVDGSESMSFGSPAKFDYARKVAAALGYIGISNTDRVSVQALSADGFQVFPLARGKRMVWKMFDFISGLKCAGGTALAHSCRQFSLRNRGKGVLVIISDFFDKNGYEDGLKQFLVGSMDVFVLHLLAAEEVDPVMVGDLRLIDVEDADVAEVSVTAGLLKSYKQNLAVFCERLREYCTSHGFSYLFASTAVPFDQLVLNYLRRAGMFK